MADLASINGLKGRISATRRKLSALAIASAWWPLLLFAALFFGAALAGIFERASPVLAALASLTFLLGSLVLFVRGLRRFRPVSRQDAIDALDRQSELRPLASITDRPADPSGGATALWKRHIARLAKEARRLRPPALKAEWKALDPFLLRAILPVILVSLLILSGSSAPRRIGDALSPDFGALMGADKMVIEAWITPPDYSGRPPIFLKAGMDNIRIPEGSVVTLRTSAHSAPRLILKGKSNTSRLRFGQTPDGAYEAQAEIMEDTRMSVRWWGERKAWQLLASPDDAPQAKFVSLPFFGTQDRTEFTWGVSDDYGVEKLELAFRLKEPNPAAPDAEERVPVPLPGLAPLEASETVQLDLTRHPWAGLAVDMQLVATDGAGQEGRSKTIPFVLPDKLFLEPLARAAQEVRVTVLREPRPYKDIPANPLALEQDALNASPQARIDYAPPEVKRASIMLDAITYDGHRYIEDPSLYFAFRMAHSILDAAATKDDADEIDSLLWAAALKAEYGSAADALRRLMAAKRALEKALREGASEDEIKRRLEAFKEAANNYVAAKMAEAIANGTQAPQSEEDMASGGSPNLGGQDFEDMLQALQDLTETGATEQARQLLSDITNMLENLEIQKGGSGGDGFPGAPGEQGENQEDLPEDEQELTEAMKKLAEILREQRQLNDDTLAEERGEQPGASGQQQSGQQSGEGQEEGEQAGDGGQQQGDGNQGNQPGQGQTGQAPGSDQAGNETSPGGEQAGNQPGGNIPGQQAGNEDGQGAGASGETLAERQERLGRLVEKFARENGLGSGAAGEEGTQNALAGSLDEDALEDIRRAQRRAAESLDVGNERRAQRYQEQATSTLSELTREIGNSLDELQQARRGENGVGGSARDPFGRMTGDGGNGEDTAIPDKAERQRAKDILDELRRRYEESEDEEEREYLQRLLDRF